MIKKFLIITFIIFITIMAWWWKNRPTPPPSAPEELKIISTKPDPLEGAILLPSQSIEITFNKPIMKTEFKHQFDPQLEHEVEVVGEKSHFGQTLRIKFTKPLELGSGYTLFVLPSTHTEEGLKLDRDIIFHFKTIPYRGV